MKILALLTDPYGAPGGIARYNTRLLSALGVLNSKPKIFALSRAQASSAETLPSSVSCQTPPGGKAGYVFSALALLLKESPFDFIFFGHLHCAALAAFLARLGRAPWWLQLHGIEAWRKPTALLRKSAERADLVTGVSRYTRRKFLEWARINPSKVKVLPNTVDGRFQPGPKPEHLLTRYRLKDKRILLTLSRLSSEEKYKGHDRVLSVMPELLKKFPDLIYVVAGEGNDRARLEARAKKEGLNRSIRFIGPVPEMELADHYRMADLFIMPSTGEGFGIVFLEAAACGVPVIGGNQDGSVDALREGQIGQALHPHDSQGMIAGIEKALNEKQIDSRATQPFSQIHFSEGAAALAQTLVSNVRNKN